MKKFQRAFAIVLGLLMILSMVGLFFPAFQAAGPVVPTPLPQNQ